MPSCSYGSVKIDTVTPITYITTDWAFVPQRWCMWRCLQVCTVTHENIQRESIFESYTCLCQDAHIVRMLFADLYRKPFSHMQQPSDYVAAAAQGKYVHSFVPIIRLISACNLQPDCMH